MKRNLCYVDPIYFIEHKLHYKANDPDSAYFNIFDEDIIQDYQTLVELDDYPNYIGSGFYDETLYYDVCRSKDNPKEFNIILESQLTETIVLRLSFIYEDEQQGLYCGYLVILEIQEEFNKIIIDSDIYFDTFKDLFGILKNEIRHYMSKL